MRKILAVLILLVWLVLIFSFSKANGEDSGALSTKLIKNVVLLVCDIEDGTDEMERIVNTFSFPLRKCAHFTEYFILGILVVNCLVTFNIRKKTLLYAVVFCILYAISDEVHQLFVSGRSGQVSDVLLDSSGSLLGSYLICRLYLFRGMYEKNHS